MILRRLAPAAVLLVPFGIPGVAGAATQVSVVPTQGLQVVVANDDDAAHVIETALTADSVQVQTDGGLQVGAGCQETGGIAVCAGTFDAVVVFGRGGADTVTLGLIADGAAPLHGEAYGGDGDDDLRAPPDFRDVPQPETIIWGENGSDTIVSGNGPDELLGGEGDDTMQSFEGPDTVRGEGGNDSVSAGKGDAADVVDGGPGVDRIPDVDADYSRGAGHSVSVSVNGVADDGEAGEGDNVVGIEKLRAFADSVTLVGSGADDDFFVDADTSVMRGLGGNDRLIAYDGNDVLEGGDGNDVLEGGFGHDTLDGGAGVDQFQGDRIEQNVIAIGNDTIRARDGNAEQIACGVGADTAVVDAGDVVDATCESVDRPPAPPPPPPPPPPPVGPGAPKVSGASTPKAVARKGLGLRVACPAACTVVAELRVSKAVARKLRLGKSRVLARGKNSIAAAGDARVTLKVAKKARKRLRKQRRVKVTLRVRTTIAGVTTPVSRKITLKR